MIVYPDASVIVSAYSEEKNTASAREWLRFVEGEEFLTSAWCVTEVASALAAKVRAGILTMDERRDTLDVVRKALTRNGGIVTVDQRHFELATALLNRSAKPLRASDALHLAIASDVGATLVTLDRRMAEAGMALGLDAELLR